MPRAKPPPRAKQAKPPATISYATALQRSRTSMEALQLAEARRPDPAQSVALLSRMTQVTPRGGGTAPLQEARAVRADPRLHTLLTRTIGNADNLAPSALCDLLWALAVLRRPLLRGEGSLRELGELLSPAASQLDPHDAAQACWAWSSLARDFRTMSVWAPSEWVSMEHDGTPPPVPLQTRASSLPFAVHLGVCQQELGDPVRRCARHHLTTIPPSYSTHDSPCDVVPRGPTTYRVAPLRAQEGSLEALLQESRPSRGTIASGSAVSLDAKTGESSTQANHRAASKRLNAPP